ncbi:hypothetical protein DM02DRAFT_661738 [Periconia macrospinosa]|uniref:Uncharacterized protein n=1 Tax=Periconia macrospinosa TaxID=97972 RepID=A0A2V1D699_9PLEO|nr:hypothetical protein DM02DRAFT_661738 [Periconia macrospinosa]
MSCGATRKWKAQAGTDEDPFKLAVQWNLIRVRGRVLESPEIIYKNGNFTPEKWKWETAAE